MMRERASLIMLKLSTYWGLQCRSNENLFGAILIYIKLKRMKYCSKISEYKYTNFMKKYSQIDYEWENNTNYMVYHLKYQS